MSADGYLILRRARDELEANLTASILEEFGIRCMVQKPPAEVLHSQPAFLVLVHESQLAEAKQILAEQQAEHEEGEEQEGLESCAFCGAPLPPAGGFCTTCGRQAGAWGAGAKAPPEQGEGPQLPPEESNTLRFLLLLAGAALIGLIMAAARRG